MHIVQDRTKKLVWLSQEKYMTKVLQRFSMSDAKPVGLTLLVNCKLPGKQSPKKKHVNAENERPNMPLAVATFKGVVSAGPANPKMCGLLKPSRVADDIISISLLEKISVQKLAPEYRVGVDPWGKFDVRAPPPMKASDIWATKATIIYCIRRPG